MPIRIYRAKQIGTGTWEDPYRSILNEFIDIHQGDWFDEIDNPLTHFSICMVYARQVAHDAIYADRTVNPGRIVYLSPLSKDDVEKRINLSILWSILPLAFRMIALNVITKDGFEIMEVQADHTLKDIIRLLIYKNFRQQRLAAGGIIPPSWEKFKFAGEDF